MIGGAVIGGVTGGGDWEGVTWGCVWCTLGPPRARSLSPSLPRASFENVRLLFLALATFRKVAESDINVLELQIMRGDPTISLVRSLLSGRLKKGQASLGKPPIDSFPFVTPIH